MMTNDNYFNELLIEFPSLRPAMIEEDAETIHSRMEKFADYTIEQIQKDNITELKKCFAFQEAKIDLMSSELKNALIVSYCEALLLDKRADRMKDLICSMQPKLKTAYTEYEQWYHDLVHKSRQ